MRSLFNNPWVVGVMAALASIYLGLKVVGPLLGGNGAQTGAAVDILDPFSAGSSSTAAGNSSASFTERSSTARNDIRWLDDIDRDPFAEHLQVGEVSTTERAAGPGNPVLPKLEALFYGSGVKAAVIKGQLRGVGELINEFRVLDVSPDAVTLEYAGKQYRIEPDAS